MNLVASSGVIIAVHGSPGPASGITYDVDVNWDDGTVRRLNGIKPTNARPPDTYDTIGASPNTDFLVHFLADTRVRIFINEYPDSAECP